MHNLMHIMHKWLSRVVECSPRETRGCGENPGENTDRREFWLVRCVDTSFPVEPLFPLEQLLA